MCQSIQPVPSHGQRRDTLMQSQAFQQGQYHRPQRMLLSSAADRNGVLKDLISETGDITGVAASNGNILYLNPAGLRWMGLAPVQDTLGTLLAESDQAQFESIIKPQLDLYGSWQGCVWLRGERSGGAPVRASMNCVRFGHSPGQEAPTEDRPRTPSILFVVHTAGGSVTMRNSDGDPTGTAATQPTSLTEAVLTLQAATQAAADILADRLDTDVLRHFAEAARHLTGARYAAISIKHWNGEEDTQFVTSGVTEEEIITLGPAPCFAGILGMIMRKKQPIRMSNIQEHPAFAGFPPGHPEMTSFVGIPLLRGSTTLGCLYLTNKQTGTEFTVSDMALLQALSVHMTMAIHFLHMHARMRSMVRGLIKAHEDERRSVAYDLHDGLTQFVMAAHANMEAYQHLHKCQETGGEQQFQLGVRYLEQAVQESRRMVNGLRALTLEELGISGALEQLLQEAKEKYGWETAELTHNLGPRRFDEMVEASVFRIAQEAITNAGKHANSPGIQVACLLEYRPGPNHAGRIVLHVHDWGVGFNVRKPGNIAEHIGLTSMRERTELMGGEFTVRSSPGKGSSITAYIPVEA